jgi:hypothetical protein
LVSEAKGHRFDSCRAHHIHKRLDFLGEASLRIQAEKINLDTPKRTLANSKNVPATLPIAFVVAINYYADVCTRAITVRGRGMKLVIGFAVLLLASSFAFASERAIVCAKYKSQSGWSDGYKVDATILNGSELNQATHSFDYESFSTYVVIFWHDNGASMIEMDSPDLTANGQEGKDQHGLKWEITKTSICY